MNNIGIFFKEIHNNILFNEYCKELTISNKIEIKDKILNDSNVMNVLLKIVDFEIIEKKIEIILEQKVKKLQTKPQVTDMEVFPTIESVMEDTENSIEKVLFYYEKTKLFRVIERFPKI